MDSLPKAQFKILCYRKSASKLQVFLGDHDWMDTNEADAFRRSVQTVGKMMNFKN